MKLNPTIKVFTYADGSLRVIGKRGTQRFSFTLDPTDKHRLFRYLGTGAVTASKFFNFAKKGR